MDRYRTDTLTLLLQGLQLVRSASRSGCAPAHEGHFFAHRSACRLIRCNEESRIPGVASNASTRPFCRGKPSFHDSNLYRRLTCSVQNQVISSRGNYWFLDCRQLTAELVRRGISTNATTTSDRLKRDVATHASLLYLDDAYNGYSPRPAPIASELHGLSTVDLLQLAVAAGYPKGAPRTHDALTEFLTSKRDVTDEIRASKLTDPLKLVALRRSLGNWLREAGVDEARVEEFMSQSYNGGHMGHPSAIGRLHTALQNGHYPHWTPSAGFRCGVFALTLTLNSLRRLYIPADRRPDDITADELMQLLFLNYDDDAGPNAVGMPTPEYEEYLQATFGHLEGARYDHEYANMTRLNNFDFQQLIAMVVLSTRTGRLEFDVQLGIVRGAHVDSGGETVPAFAQVVYNPRNENDDEGTDYVPTAWIRHNLAASADYYNHWEGFGPRAEGSDWDTPFERGLSTDSTPDMVRRQQLSKGLRTVSVAMCTNIPHILTCEDRSRHTFKTSRRRFAICQRSEADIFRSMAEPVSPAGTPVRSPLASGLVATDIAVC